MEEQTKTMSVRVTAAEQRAVRVLSAVRGTTQREWFEDAFRRFLEKRQKEGQDRSLYRATPADGENVTVVCSRELAERIREWANRDNVRYTTAYFTAIRDQLMRENLEEIDEFGGNEIGARRD
jgi:hypothetical protein